MAEQLLTQADLCLYLSKKQGRNRVTGERLSSTWSAAAQAAGT